ncbi:type VII secretion protein EssA [Alkalihalophilus pseudofirmus]|uniref:Type VII secretion protein EssA n=1 Tax=Alkalihalophilus pseudofirmus TaxID=79885 RepID=A0AAJ2U2L0_ALKPS|nr:type VII secretion protein EssA [Alkalihalophilus pseudofirmus]MDV2887174.1 type VII secretion protein EssA [Alkalihalophilus pseudofirmus]
MKAMKLLNISAFVCLLFFLLPSLVLAEGDPVVEPQEYKERQINVDLNYYREDERVRREALSEEQRVLTFTQREMKYFDEVYEELFQTGTIEVNTITAKAERLDLFNGETEPARQSRTEQESETGIVQISTILIAVVILMIAILMFVVIPRLMKKPDKYEQLT